MCREILSSGVSLAPSSYFFVTTIFSYAGWANLFSQDEDILLFLQVASLLAAVVAAVGLIVTRRPPGG